MGAGGLVETKTEVHHVTRITPGRWPGKGSHRLRVYHAASAWGGGGDTLNKEVSMSEEKEFPMFSYQLKSTLEQMTDLVEKLPGIIPDEIRQNAEASFSDLQNQIERSKKLLEVFQNDLSGFQQKACDLYDESYKKIKEKKRETDKRMEDLTNLKEIKCHIPYNFSELINMAERLSHLTDEQFNRILDLARAFAGEGDA